MNRCGFLGGREAIISLRSSGYKDTSMAIGELIDNSIQAGATEITLVVRTERGKVNSRDTRRVKGIAVIDNGNGMNSDTLQRSLVLGEGLNRNTKGMGKYGVGLPQSSISQAKKVDVWSWQNNSKPNHVYVDLDDESWLNDAEIKDPDMKEIPDDLIEYTSQEHGTIVLWSDADRISWKKATTVFEKCENKIGRMYRYWLNDGSIKLRMVLLDQNGHILPNGDNYFRAVDPLFLMENAKYEDSPEKPMFEIYRNRYLKNYQVEVNGEIKQATVEMNFSIAKKSIRYSDDDEKLIAGNKKYGKLAKECIGVSIVRENRELELCDSWYITKQKDPRHRWWGAEIKFDSILDEVFGVTNNKQSANHLTELARKNIEELNSEFNLSTSNLDEDLKQLQDDSPNSYILYDVITQIHSTISKMDASVEGQLRTTKAHKANRHESDVKTKSMYDDLVTKRSKDEETRSTTDLLVEERGENRAPSVEQSISKNPEYSSEDRKKILDDVTLGHRCSIVAAPVDSSSFFNIVAEDTQMIIKLNTQHPMYDKLFGVFDSILCGSEDAETTKIMVRDAFDSVQFLLASWARMEDESKTAEQRISYRRIREQWGSILEESFKP